MVFTEIKTRNQQKYYYRVLSIRKGKKVSKKRKYLGVNLSEKELQKKEMEADQNLRIKSKKETESLRKIKQKIIKILKKNKIKKAGIFGSYVRGKQKKKSDIDILILPPKNMSLLGFVHVKNELENKLGIKIDLVSYRGIHPLLKKQILDEEVKII